MTQASRSDSVFRYSVANGRRIKQARELAGFTQAELAEKIGVSQGLIGQIERLFKRANPELVQRIARQTDRFQPSFFYREPEIEFPAEAVMFRAMTGIVRTEETQARRYAEVTCELAGVLLEKVKPIKFGFNSFTSAGPAEAAEKVRSRLRLPSDQPIAHLIREIEKSGVLVLALPMDLPKRNVLSLRTEHIDMPVIALAIRGVQGEHVRLSAAHELGHIVLGHAKAVTPQSENQADQFGAELLMPERAMKREMMAPITLSLLTMLKARWRVSIQALIQRGRELGILDESRFTYLDTQVSVKKWRKNEPVEIPLEKPRLLRQLTEQFYDDLEPLVTILGFRREFILEILSCYDRSMSKEDRTSPSNVIAVTRR